ncbi:UNVERIFIED_CONTAM: hypothetical protein RMT77_011333 [Armadillidium vulgare]
MEFFVFLDEANPTNNFCTIFENIPYEIPKKNPIIRYDLSQNLILSIGMVSLRNHALNFCIGNCFKKVFMDLLESKEISIDDNDNLSITYSKFQKIEKIVEKKLLEDLRLISYEYKYTHYLRQSNIHFMAMQILGFICKRTFLTCVNFTDLFRTMVFTSQGTINLLKSVLQFNIFNAEPIENFRMKCHFFLENEIKDCYESLDNIERLFVRQYINTDPILEFWVLEINPFERESHKDFSDKYEDLFFESIESNNEIAVEYLWNNKISKLERGRAILEKTLKSIINNSLKTNIMMFLLFQVNENEIEEFFQTCSFKVIKNVIMEVRWHCLFDKIFNVLKIYLNSESILKIFAILAKSHCENCPVDMNLNLAVNYFGSLSESDKIFILDKCTPYSTSEVENHFGKVLSRAISNVNKDEYLEKLLRFKNVTPLKNFFLSLSGYESLIEHAKTGYLYSFFDFLINILNNDIYYLFEVKRVFFHHANEIICIHFIQESNFSKMREFVNYFSEYYQHIQQFKDKIPYLCGGEVIRETLFPTYGILNYESLEKTDEMLIWCLNTSKKAKSFKDSMNFIAENRCRIIYFDKILSCVKNSRFTFLKRLFEWKGLKNKEKTELLKKLMNSKNLHEMINNLNHIEKQTFVENFASFLEYETVISSDEITSFKQRFEGIIDDNVFLFVDPLVLEIDLKI